MAGKSNAALEQSVSPESILQLEAGSPMLKSMQDLMFHHHKADARTDTFPEELFGVFPKQPQFDSNTYSVTPYPTYRIASYLTPIPPCLVPARSMRCDPIRSDLMRPSNLI